MAMFESNSGVEVVWSLLLLPFLQAQKAIPGQKDFRHRQRGIKNKIYGAKTILYMCIYDNALQFDSVTNTSTYTTTF